LNSDLHFFFSERIKLLPLNVRRIVAKQTKIIETVSQLLGEYDFGSKISQPFFQIRARCTPFMTQFLQCFAHHDRRGNEALIRVASDRLF
jgi:hypothetical protein